MTKKPRIVKPKRGTILNFAPKHSVWIDRTPEELEALYEDDRRTGDTMDSAGERRIHSPVGRLYFKEDTQVVVVKANGIEWKDWSPRPTGLVQGRVLNGPHAGRLVMTR